MKKTKLLLLSLCFLTLQILAQKTNPENEKAVTTSTISLEKLIQQKSDNYVITHEHISKVSGVHHIYLRQAINGLEVCGTESSLHLDKAGNTIATQNKFVDDIQVTVKNASPRLTAEQAINSVARQMGYTISNLQLVKSLGGINKKAVFNEAGISFEEIPVKLMYYYREGLETVLVWELSIAELNSSNWWNFRVDANTGLILDKSNWTDECAMDHVHANEGKTLNYNSNLFDIPDYDENATFNATDGIGSYRVFAMPIESPYYGTRSLEVNPENSTASPYGWHDTDGAVGAEYTITRGNNTHAFKQSDGFSPDGGTDLLFDYTVDFTLDPTTGGENLSASVTNLFYWNNIIHDVMYQYGFDEAAGNFQQNNYGKGGTGSDYVKARAQYGVLCNAFFSTPVDGSNGSMRMYLCANATPNKDGDFDNLVIAHEYGHGISNRLTGGAANSSCLGNDEQMGEGWSDFYGYMLTMTSGDSGTTARGVGNYLFDYGANGPGIRKYRYSTDMTVNPHTYDDIKTTGSSPHALGTVWASMLWDLTWGLIDQYGFDSNLYTGTGGNNMALKLVTEALKLQPCSPGFVDGRDAILAADVAIYGGANRCLIWSTFARRGLGLSALQGDTDDRTDGTEAFDTPDPPIAVCVAPFALQLDASGVATLTAADIDGGSTDTCGIASLEISPASFTCADVGNVEVTLTVTDTDGNTDTCSTMVTIEKHPTTLTYTGDLEGQYTDPVTLAAQLLDADGFGIVGKTIDFTIGTQSTSAVTDVNGDATVELILTQGPGNYTVESEFTEDACFVGSTDSDPFEITPEDALVEYTGHTLQATPNQNSSEADVVLSANILEVFDGYPGDIRNATVKFVNRDSNTDISPWIPVTDLFDPSDPSIGTVSYNWHVDLGNQSSESFTIGIIVGGCYTRDDAADDIILTVYVPVGDFVTGGGYINPVNSAGTYASTPGLRLNFGYNIGFNKNGKRLKGHMNIIFRIEQLDGIHTYQIKSNAIQSLGVNIADESNKIAEFMTKANLKDITDPLNPVSLGGNLSLSVDMSDRGEPGTDDSISFNLTDADNILLYSSEWSGIATEEITLSGGNLVVHSGFSLGAFTSFLGEVKANNLLAGNLSMYPNPAKDYVILRNPQEIELNSVSIYDLKGRLISNTSLRDMGTEKMINVSALAETTYLIIITSENGQITKQLIKE